MLFFIRNKRPVIYDEDFLEPAVFIPPTKPLTTPPITTETPDNSGVSVIVEPNLSNPSGTTTGNTTGNTSGNTSSNTSGNTSITTSGNTSGTTTSNTTGNTSGSTSGSNGENKFSATITAKKTNYVLYGGILISAIILYKLLK